MKNLLSVPSRIIVVASYLFISACGPHQSNSTVNTRADKAGNWIEIKTTIGESDFCLTLKRTSPAWNSDSQYVTAGTFLTWQNGCGNEDSYWSYKTGRGDLLQFFQTTDYDLLFINAHKNYDSRQNYYEITTQYRSKPVDFNNPYWSHFSFVERQNGGVGLVTMIRDETNKYVCLGDKNYQYGTETVDMMSGLELHTPVVDINQPLPDTCAAIRIERKSGPVENLDDLLN